MLAGKHIILGVTGSIAAYKAVLLARELKKRDAELRVVMTDSAGEFITPLTLATVSGNEVITSMFPPEPSKGTWHIHLGMWADLMLIAPASANTIAKIAHGFADNALTSLVLALRCPLVVAPAMDMYMHAATQENISILRKRGVKIIEPASGELASGLDGIGRLPEPQSIIDYVDRLITTKQDLAGKKILITAGPTHEPIDPVRFISNHSSGKMGVALARAAAERGADIVLITGPVHLDTPSGVKRKNVTTAEQMFEAVHREATNFDVIIMAAAVADFTPTDVLNTKMKKESMASSDLHLQLRKTTDILAYLGEERKNSLLVGFALETDNAVENAREKLRKKNVDIIVLNNALEEGAGFGVDTNKVTLLHKSGLEETTGVLSKDEIAHFLLDRIGEFLKQK